MSTAVTLHAVRSNETWPLTTPFTEFDAGMAPCPEGLPVVTLLATDDGWDWLEQHAAELVAAAHELSTVVPPDNPAVWTIGEFHVDAHMVRLVTRGHTGGRVIPVAVLDIDQMG